MAYNEFQILRAGLVNGIEAAEAVSSGFQHSQLVSNIPLSAFWLEIEQIALYRPDDASSLLVQ